MINIYAYMSRTFMKKVCHNMSFIFLYNFIQNIFAEINIKESTIDIDTEIHAYCHVMCSSFLTIGMGQEIWVKPFLIVNGDENLFISFEIDLCMQMDREQFQ